MSLWQAKKQFVLFFLFFFCGSKEIAQFVFFFSTRSGNWALTAMANTMKRVSQEPPTSPLKMARSSCAIRFSLSPKVLPVSEAIQAKEQGPHEISLMPVENKELTLQEARLRAAGGGDILVSPRGLETNREFLKMRKISDLFKGCDMDALHMFFQGLDAKGVYHDLLYNKFVGSSPEVCEADVIKVVSSCLDYYVKATIQQDEMKYAQLVGNNLPFASTSGNNVTYFKLLHYVDMHPTPSEEVTLARELVSAAENRLLMDFGINPSDPDTPALALRASLRIFNRSLLRKERVTSAHLISEILFTDCNSPLCQQDLSQKLHAVKDNIWNMENPRHLYQTGLRVIVLEHLQQKYETEGLREGYLLYHLGFNAMKYFLRKMVPYSMTFHFGELHGTIKKDGEDVSLHQNHDLIALRRSLASP